MPLISTTSAGTLSRCATNVAPRNDRWCRSHRSSSTICILVYRPFVDPDQPPVLDVDGILAIANDPSFLLNGISCHDASSSVSKATFAAIARHVDEFHSSQQGYKFVTDRPFHFAQLGFNCGDYSNTQQSPSVKKIQRFRGVAGALRYHLLFGHAIKCYCGVPFPLAQHLVLHRRDCDASPSTNKALSLYSWYQNSLARVPGDRPVIGEERKAGVCGQTIRVALYNFFRL